MITLGILAAAAADVVLVELEDGWRYVICLQARAERRVQASCVVLVLCLTCLVVNKWLTIGLNDGLWLVNLVDGFKHLFNFPNDFGIVG